MCMETFVVRPRDTTCHTLLYAAHDAFRRDLDRLAAAVAAGKAGPRTCAPTRDNFKDQLRMHHDLEDRLLWPRVERAVAGRPAEVAVLSGDARRARRYRGAGRPRRRGAGGRRRRRRGGRALRDALEAHLRHEEATALPLAESVLEAGSGGPCTPTP